MNSVFDQGPPPPCPAPFNMASYVLNAGNAPDAKTAIEVLGPGGQSLTYGALRAQVGAIATGLLAAGLAPGDRLLFRLGNHIAFPLAYLAAIWAGIIPVPTSAQLTSAEVGALCKTCRPSAILAQDGVALPDGHALPVIAVDALDAMTGLAPAAPVLGDPNRLAYIIFTSGTSGTPRGVCHAHRAIWARRMMYDGWYGLRPTDRLLHAGAFNWTYTLGTGLMDPWAMGATALIPADGTAIEALPALLVRAKASIFAAAPGVYRRMLRATLPQMPKLRHGLSAGEHLSETIRDAWRAQTGLQLHQAMGMSECSTFISSNPETPAPPDCSGRPQQGRRVAILNNATPAPYGVEGALAVSTRDPGLMLGYLGAEPVQGDWFETGDMASMAPDGTIRYLGRTDDMMNAGGYRVSPLEVEAHFNDTGLVTACAAVSVPLKADADVIALYYTGEADEHALRAHAQLGLAAYKQPRLYIRRDAIPYGANGKLNRRALRETFEAP